MGSQGIAGTAETILVLEQKKPALKMLSFIMTGKEVEQREIAYNWNSPGFIGCGDARFAGLGSFQKAVFNYIKEHPRCTQATVADA